MWNLITGKSSESYEVSPSGIRRRKDNDQRQPSESLVSPKSARKPSRGDDRDGNRGFRPTSTSYSSTSRSSYPGTASASIASSYATASNGQTDDAVIHPDVVRDASLADQLPKSQSSHKDRDQDRARERKSERRRSSSRDRKRDRDGKRRDRKGDRDKVDRGGGMDRGLTRSGNGYAEEMSTPRTGETFAHASGSFNAQVGGSGFTQFPGQYDGGMPGFASGPPTLHESMSAHVQDQFPGQFPLESAAPYRPPLAASEGGPGLAADYYGVAGESVASQPGVRPQPLGPIIGAEPHLQPASHIAQPPPEPSSAGGVGAAASFYSGVDLPSTLPSQPSMTSKPPKTGKPSKPSSSGSFSGSAALAGSAVLGYTAGTTGEASYTQGSGSNGSAYYQQGSGRPPSSATGTAAYSSTSAPTSNSYHASSAPVLPTLDATAAGAAAGYMMGSHSSAQQQPSGHSGYSSSATQRPPLFGDHYVGTSVSSRPPRPARYSPLSSSLSFHSAGQSNPMAQKHRHRRGPLGTFVEFWTDPDGVAQYEEYTEYIGVCKNCFAPGSTPRDAPRKHHYRRRRSDERYGSSTRVDKESRWGSSDGENRRRSRKSWLAGGIAGYGLAEVGKTLFNQKRGADGTYNVRFSRGNASDTSLRRRSGSDSPSRRSRTSYGVTGESSASISRRRSRSRERVETGITSDGKIYRKDPHGSLLGGPAIKTYTPRRRSRSRSRSRSRDRHNGHAAAALGATLGSSVVAPQSRRRDRSSDKASVRSHYRGRERSPRREEVSMLSSFFSSPPEKRQRSHRKKKRGFFSFGNSSSSSADADLAFGAGIEISRDRKRLSTRSRNDRNAGAAFLGLSAAAAAIALRESQKGNKSSRKADVVAVKETKSKKRVTSEHHQRGRRTSASPTMEEDVWESASDEDDLSSVSSALAYGGNARRSQESLTSDSSGMGKWSWRWGSKKKSKRTVQAGSTADNFGTNAGTAAATLAGALASGAVTSNTSQLQNDSRMSSSSNLPPLQQVYPVPTSDPSRFDVTRRDSIASSNQPLMTSRPAPVPLQQPQPIVPVSHAVYTTQPLYGHSYSAPSGPPVFSQIPYQPQPSNVGDSRDTSSGPTQTNLPGSFPGGGTVADNAVWDARTEFSNRRRETFPVARIVEPEVDPLPRRQRASTRDESSAVRFDFSEEPKGEDLYDWRRRQVGPDQRQEEIKVQDAHQQRQADHESMSSNGVSTTKYMSEPAENMDRKGASHLNRGEDESRRRKPDSRVVPIDTIMVGAAITAAASEVAHIGAETHQEDRREDDRKDRIKKREDPANDEIRYSSGKGTGVPDSVEQHVQTARRVLSGSVKNPNHENYAAYFVPLELLSKSNDNRQSTEVNGDSDVTSDQVPQNIAVEPKGSGLSFIPAHAHTDEVDFDHISLPWQVPRLNLIEPTPPHSVAGSTKGGTSPVTKPEGVIEETKEIPRSFTTPKVTWGKDETHTYQVVTPLENPDEFTSTSTMLHNEEEDIESSSEESPLDDSPIIVERVPRRMPGDFGDDLEFAATVAAGLEDTGFDPAIVIDDATFRRRDSPPGSETTGFYRSPFADTIIDLGLDSPGTEGAPPQQGFVEGELPPTPKYEEGPSASGGNADVTASKPSKKDSKSRKNVAEHEGDVDVPGAFDTRSELHDRGGVSDDPRRYSAQPQRRVSVPVNVFDYLDEGSRVEDSKAKGSKKSDDGLGIMSSGSPRPADVARSEYFDAPEAAAEVLKSSSSSQGFDDVTVDVPATEQPVADFQEPKRADKRQKKSRKSEQDGQTFGSPTESQGSTALERNGEISSKVKSDRKSSRRDSERYDPSDRDLRSVVSDPVSGKDREEGKSRSRDNLDNNNLYDSSPEDTRPTPAYAPIEDEFDKPRRSKKKSQRGSSGYDEISASASPSAAVDDKRDSKSKSKKNKKGGLFGIFSASKSSDKLSETAQAQDAAAEKTSDTYEEPKRKNKKSKERRSIRDGDDVSTQASDRLMEDMPVPALPEAVDVEGNPDDFEDANAKRKKSKDRKANHTYDGDGWYGPADQSSSNLFRRENDDDGGKSRRKEYKRRSQESDLVEESGRVTQALQAKDRDLPNIRKAPIIKDPNVVDTNADSGENEKTSFLEERQTTPPPPDIHLPADPHSHYADKSVENSRPLKVEHETEASQFTGTSGSPSTSPSTVFPLEDLPSLPASRPASPVPVSEDHMRRTSVVQASDSPQNPLVNSSPTAIPLHFRRPPASPGPARSSPFASPTTPNQRALDFVPPQRRSRPNSTEFKSSTEFRPLWLVERHGSRQETAPVESYPSLPSSHTTSRSSSVHDPEEVGSQFFRDDGLSDSHAVSDGEDSGLRIDVSRSFEREDLLGSRQATPTAASFHLDTKDNVLTETMQDSGQAETIASREDSAKEATRGVSPSSPKRLSHSVGDDLPQRYVLSPIRLEGLEDLPPLPTSRSSSPLLEGYGQETSATLKEAEKIEELPSLPASRSSFSLPEGLGRETSSMLKEAEQLEGLPPLPVSRSSSPLRDIQGRKTTLTSEKAGQLEELSPLPASRSSSPLHDSQRREISSLSDEAKHLEKLPPLPASRSSSPLHDSQQRGMHSVSGEATQVEKLPRLLVGRSSSPLHDSQIGGISPLSEKDEQLEELPPLPASGSSSPLRGSQHIGIHLEPEEFEQIEELSTLLLDRSSSPLHGIQGRKATFRSEEAEQLEKLRPLPVSRSSSPLHGSQRRGISSVSDEAEPLEELPSLPASRSSSLSLEHETLDTSSMQKGAAVGAIVGLAAVTAAVAVVNIGKAAAGDSLPATEANPASVVDEPTRLREDEPQKSTTPKILAKSEVLSTKNSKKDGKGRKASSSRRKDDLPFDDETVAQSLKGQDVRDTVTEDHNDVQEEDGQGGPDVWFSPSTSKKTKKERKGKRKGRGGGGSNTPLDSLTTLEIEAPSVEESRAVSPSGALTVGDSPGPDIITLGQTAEVAQDDWPGFATDSRKSKGKKGKKKLSRSGQEETIEPGAIELDTVLEGPPETVKSQRPTADHGGHNPRNPPLSDTDAGLIDLTGQSTKEVARDLVSDSGEAELFVATNQEGEKIKEHVLLEGKPDPDRAPTLQQPLDIVGQELQSPSDKLHSVKDFSETRNAVLTPQGNLDEEFFTPMGMPQSTQETEAKTEYPFPTRRGKASKKAKKNRKTVALANYVEPLDSPMESEEPEVFPATRSMSGGIQAEEAGESMGATSIPSNSAFEPAVALAYTTVRSSDRKYHPKAASPTFRGLSAISVAPEATPLPMDDDLDLLEAPPANSNDRISSPEAVSLPLDQDFVLIEAPQASSADRLMTLEAIRLPTNEDFDLNEAPRASPAQELLTPAAVPLPGDEDLDLTEASRASPAQELLAPAAVPLPGDEGLDLTEAPRANLAQKLLAPEAVLLAVDEGSGLIEAPQARPADQLLTPEAVPLPRGSYLDLIEAPHPNPAVHFLAPEAVPLPTDEDLELVEAPPAAEQLLTLEPSKLLKDSDHDLVKASYPSPAVQSLAPEAVPLPTDEDLKLVEAPSAAEQLLTLEPSRLLKDSDNDLVKASQASPAVQSLTPEAVPLPTDEDLELVEAPSAAEQLLTLEPSRLLKDSDNDLVKASQASPAVQSLAPEAPPAAEQLLTPGVVPLPRDNGHDLIETSSASLVGHSLKPEAVLLPINGDLPVIVGPVGSADKFSTPGSISSSSLEDPNLIEASRASLADPSSNPESVPLPIDEDSSLNTPLADSADKLSTPVPVPIPVEEEPNMMIKASSASFADQSLPPDGLAPRIDEDLDLIEASASSADRFLTSEAMSLPIHEDIGGMKKLPENPAERFLSPEAVPLPIDEDLDLIEPAASSADRFLTSEAMLLPTDEDINLVNAPPENPAERFLSAEEVPLPTDKDLDLIEPATSPADRFLTSEALPTDKGSDLMKTLPENSTEQPLTLNAVPLPTDKGFDLVKVPLESPAERLLGPEEIPLPIDEDLDLLSALPASPVLQTTRITSRESGSAPDYSSRSITEKEQASTLLPSTLADEPDQLVLDRASGNTTLEKDYVSDELAVTQPMPEHGYDQQASSPALASLIGDIPPVHDSSPSANVIGSLDRSPTQEFAEEFLTVVSQKNGKKGKKGNQISSIIPDLGPAPVESELPVIATEPGTVSVDRALGTATPQEQMNENDWDVPSTKNKGKQGKKDKSGFREPENASQEAVISADLLDHRTVTIKDTQGADTVKDLTNPAKLGENLGLPESEKEPSSAWEPFQKKSKKGKKSKTRTQQSPSGDSALTVGEMEESPAMSANSLAATDTSKAVRESMADTSRTPDFGTSPREIDAANPFLSGIKPQQMILENPSTSEDHLITNFTSKERSIEPKEDEVSTSTVSVPDNLLAFEGKLAFTSTAMEVQRMLADRGSPRPSDDLSRKDGPLIITQALKEPPYEDDDTWDIPIKKNGKKGKKSRPLQGPGSSKEESSMPPTPPVEPETAPSNKDAMVEAAEKFIFKKSKKEKKGKKKALGQASSSFQVEGKAEVGVMPEINKGSGKENALEQSYFDRAIQPTEIQESSLLTQTLSEDSLEYAASVPLSLDEVGDKATDVVAVKGVQESDVAWSRAVDIVESEVVPVNSSRSQQLSTSLPDAQSIADRSRELSTLGIPDPTAIQTAPMIEGTRDSTIEDDSTALPTENIGKKTKRQQRKQLEQERVDTAEYEPLPTSVLPEVPETEEELESSFPVNRTASEGRFSPEMGAASRDALRELELEDGVSYFGLTSVGSGKDDRKQSKYHGTAFADEGHQSAVHGGHPTNCEVLHSFPTAPHERTLATIVEQPDNVDPVALGRDPDSQLVDQGASNQKNSSQLFGSTSKEVESTVGAMEFGTGSHSVEESESRGSHIDDAPVREATQLLATTDSSIAYPPSDSLSIGHLASGSTIRSVAREYMSLPSNKDVSTPITSRKSKKGKKGKRKQELLWDDDTVPRVAPDPEESPIENLEAPPSRPSFEAPEPGTSHSYIGNLPAEQREYEPSIEATLPTPRSYTAPDEQLTVDGADEDRGYSTKKTKKKAKKMKQQADLAQSIEKQPQLEKIAERDAAASSVDPVGSEQQQLDKVDIPRKLQEPQKSQQSDLHMLGQHADPALMAKDGEHTPVSIIEPYSLPSGITQNPIPMADINEVTKDRQIEHGHATVHFDHPQEVTATNKENQDVSWDFPTTKKSKKSKKSKKQSPWLDMDTEPQEVQPESRVDQLHQYTSTMSHDQPLSVGRPEVSKSVSPPQVTGHGGDGQFVGAGALAAIGSGVAAALLHNKSEEKGDISNNQGEDRQLIAHEVERMESPSSHDKVAQPSEGSSPLGNATQHRIPAQSQLCHDSRSSLPRFPEDEQRQDIARPLVPSSQYDDDAKRDSAVQMSDSPVISERLHTYEVVRDSGYQGTESSSPIGTDPEFADASATKHHSEIFGRPSTLARHEEAKTFEQIGGYEDTASYNGDNPLNISIEVDPTYEVAISRHKTKRGSGRVRSNFQDGNFDENVSPHSNSSRAMDLETSVQYFDESPQPSPVDSATQDRSSVLLQSSPSIREERTNQPIQADTLHASHSNIEPMDMSRAYNDNRGNLSEPEMSPKMVTHDGAPILAARASSLAALSGLTDAHRDSPKSLFGGPVGINSDLASVISPPRTSFSLENSGRRQLKTITEHSPEESLHHKQARALSDIGSPERGTKSARRSVTPREISQRRVRSPTITGTTEKSLISTDDVLARLSWPAVDEDKHSVDLERSRSRNTDRRPSSRHSNVSALVNDGVKQRESEHRSLSGASIRSGESINAIIRTPEQFRSASALSNQSGTPPLRRVDTRSVSGDLRAASKRGEAENLAKPAESEAEPAPAPTPPAFSLATPSSSTYDPVKDKGKSRVKEMADIYEGWGDVHNNGSPLSPTRPPSMRRRQSMQIMDLESKVDQLVSENRLLQDAKSRAERGLEDAHHDHVQKSSAFEGAIETRDAYLTQKDTELGDLRRMLQSLQNEVTRLAEVNRSLETTREAAAGYAQRYTELQAEHSDTHEQWQQSRRELEDLRSQHSQLSTGMEGIVRHEVSIALEEKNAELARLREELEEAKEQVRTLQRQILASKPSDNFLIDRDEDYFDTQCQQLCQRVQQWILRFSKLSDMKASRLMGDIDDEKVLDRLDNAILDGSDVDNFLADRVKRRDVLMSMVMTMIWEYVFTRYLFGMDREQRQKLKVLEKNLAEVGPMTAVHKWRATTLTLLSKREAFVAQRSQDSEAVVQEIYGTLSMFLPPPSHLENQIRESLRNVMKAAIDLSIEMRTQRAEYVMLPPLQPEYNTNGDLARKVYFNASTMNERSGDTSSNEELEAQKAVVRMVLFPLVVKKDEASGIGEKIVVCPAQVLVAKPGKDKKVVRVVSGDRMDIDRAGNRSVQSFAPSSMDMGMGNMI